MDAGELVELTTRYHQNVPVFRDLGGEQTGSVPQGTVGTVLRTVTRPEGHTMVLVLTCSDLARAWWVLGDDVRQA